jgi:hypothetical protein
MAGREEARDDAAQWVPVPELAVWVAERIEVGYPGDPDGWRCVCGNVAEHDGFYPCDRYGFEVDPTPAEWSEPLYVCGKCGRIVSDGAAGVIVGRRSWAHRTDDDELEPGHYVGDACDVLEGVSE